MKHLTHWVPRTLTPPSQALRALGSRHLAFGAPGATQMPWEEQPEKVSCLPGNRTNEPRAVDIALANVL